MSRRSAERRKDRSPSATNVWVSRGSVERRQDRSPATTSETSTALRVAKIAGVSSIATATIGGAFLFGATVWETSVAGSPPDANPVVQLVVCDESGRCSFVSRDDTERLDESSTSVLPERDLIAPDLSGASLANSDLTGTDLSGARLLGMDLTEADLTDANLSGADLTGADLTGADLTGADLTDANLSGVVCDETTVWPNDLDASQRPACPVVP